MNKDLKPGPFWTRRTATRSLPDGRTVTLHSTTLGIRAGRWAWIWHTPRAVAMDDGAPISIKNVTRQGEWTLLAIGALCGFIGARLGARDE